MTPDTKSSVSMQGSAVKKADVTYTIPEENNAQHAPATGAEEPSEPHPKGVAFNNTTAESCSDTNSSDGEEVRC